jgi:hypothetical protein
MLRSWRIYTSQNKACTVQGTHIQCRNQFRTGYRKGNYNWCNRSQNRRGYSSRNHKGCKVCRKYHRANHSTNHKSYRMLHSRCRIRNRTNRRDWHNHRGRYNLCINCNRQECRDRLRSLYTDKIVSHCSFRRSELLKEWAPPSLL